MSAEGATRTSAKVFGILGAFFVIAYPIYVYVALEHVSTRPLALGLAVLLGVGLIFRFKGARREHALVAARVPMTLVAILLVGSFFDDRRFVLALPVVTNVLFLTHFVVSLRTMPIAERFARAQEGELSPRQVSYCRSLTVAWSVFFVVNGAICAGLALFAPIAWWTLYTGLLSYMALGTMVAVEYVIRKARFRTYGAAPIDRALSRIFPPRPVEAEPLRVPK
jgi:uncharacterized membrane protein